MALESKLSAEVLDKYFAIKSIEEEEDWSTEKFRAAFKKALTHVRTVKEVQYSVRKQKAGERIISLTTTTNKNTNNSWYGNNQNRNFAQFRPSNNRNFSPNREKFRDKNFNQNRENYNRDRSRSFSPSSEEEKRNNQYRKRRDSPFPDRGKSSSDSQSRSREKEIICALCSKNHTEVDCTKYKSAEERRNACLKKELCFYCLFKGHMASQCRRRRTCVFCRKAHHSALCRKKYGNIREKVNLSLENINKVEELKDIDLSNLGKEIITDCRVNINTDCKIENNLVNSCLLNPESKMSLFKVIPVKLYNPLNKEKIIKEFALLDDGSQKSYIEEELAKELKLCNNNIKKFQIEGIGKTKMGTFEKPIVEFGIRKGSFDKLIKARALPTVLNNLPYVSIESIPKEQLNRNKLLAELQMIKPRLLIGNDHYNKFIISTKEQLPSGFWLSSSKVGNILNGEGKILNKETEGEICGYSYIDENNTGTLEIQNDKESYKWEDLVRKQESLQFMGLSDAIEKSDEEVKKEMEKLVTYDGQRYQTALLWNSLAEKLPHNKRMAYAQLKNMVTNLREKPHILKQIDEIFKEHEKMELIERIAIEENTENRVHYLPHFAVFREDKEHTKIREVFNGAAKSGNAPSLNECLEKGPNLFNDLTGIQIRARLQKYLIGCDIAKAFLQINLDPVDRDVTRFLWMEDPLDENSKIIAFRFKRVTFGIICSPAHLALVIQIHLKKYNTDLAREIERNIYVDNIIIGVEDEKEILNICQQTKLIFEKANMPIREFISNSEQINKLPIEERIVKDRVKFLGLEWNVKTDEIYIKFPKIEVGEKLTKRKLLSQSSKLFDPMGLCAPILIEAKLFRQEIDKNRKVGWDKLLTNKEREKWIKIISEWNNQNIVIKRKIHNVIKKNIDKYEIHAFSDASQIAFGAAIYLRVITKDEIITKLIFGKSLIIPSTLPTKRRTIPNLELHATMLCAKYSEFVKKELEKEIKVDKIQIWTDAKDVIDFLHSRNRLDVFTANRVKLIQRILRLGVPQLRNYNKVNYGGMDQNFYQK
ncbi:unnamed protein product [Meloidogyne enterolobii]|uniref:Uncharacterized protein n=1 Tax=Meloidogyne enterolobii TaxID=390850 RepID=A0ACB0YFV0_MELEN